MNDDQRTEEATGVMKAYQVREDVQKPWHPLAITIVSRQVRRCSHLASVCTDATSALAARLRQLPAGFAQIEAIDAANW